jgi:hypothetical protein
MILTTDFSAIWAAIVNFFEAIWEAIGNVFYGWGDILNLFNF